MAEEPSKKPKGLNPAIIIVLVGVILIIVLLYLSKRARAIFSDDVCAAAGPGFELTFLPEFGGWKCFDGITVKIPVCPDGKFWFPVDGTCLTECPPEYSPSPAKECFKTGPVIGRGLITGRLIESGSGIPIQNWEVHIEYLHSSGVIISMTTTDQDGKFLFDIEIDPSPTWIIIEVFIGGGNKIRRTANGVIGDHDFGDFEFSTAPPGPPEFHRVYQVREYLGGIPFDDNYPLDSSWKVFCDPVDLSSASGAWKGNVFYHDWSFNLCPDQDSEVPDDKPYFLFRRSDGVYFVIQDGKDLSESREIGGPYP